ncbi:MAG TPA: amidohydrolase [Candidatus Limnocylindria bacterium]|nr:amidohydrolase [Candidatus Limnocylindria bacterium]
MAEEAGLIVVGASIDAVSGPSVGSGADALAVSAGRIAAIGPAAEIRPLARPATRVVELAGETLIPGFIDAHVHPIDGGLTRAECDLYDISGADQYVTAIAQYAAAHPNRPWITGGGWSLPDFPGGTPRRELLDEVVPDRPAILYNRDGHGVWVNTAALTLAGIDRDTTDPVDGRIERDANGEASGTLHEGAIDLVASHAPPTGHEDRVAGLLEGQRHLHTLGITGWQDAIVRPDDLAAYRDAHSSGRLTAHVRLALLWDNKRGLEQIDELVASRESAASGGLDAGSVKLFVDGIIENGTALTVEPYQAADGSTTDNRGIPMIEPDLLRRAVSELDRREFQCHFHAIGDGAVRLALDSIEAALVANGASEHRHHIAHLELIHPDDIGRFAKVGAVANIQPFWAMHEAQMRDLRIPVLGLDRARWQFPFRSLLDGGARLAAGSDWPVTTPNPMLEMEVAVTRTDVFDRGHEPLFPQERLTLDEALAAFTIGSAYVNHREAECGSIEVGKRADFAILDRNIRSPDVGPLGETQVIATFVDGQPVWENT